MTENTNNMTLEEIMSRAPRTSTNIDLTNPKSSSIIEENRKTPMGTYVPNTRDNVQAATVVQTGPTDFSNARSINVHDILPSRHSSDIDNSLESNLMKDLDNAIAREKVNITNRIDSIIEKQDEEIAEQKEREEQIKQDAEDEFAINGTSILDSNNIDYSGVSVYDDHHYKEKPANVYSAIEDTEKDADTDLPWEMKDDTEEVSANIRSVSILDNVDNSDLFDDENDATKSDVNDDDEVEKMLNDLKSAVKEKITPIKNKINIGAFSIAKKAESVQKVMKLAVNSHVNVADWVLYSENRPVSITGLSGAEILKLNPENSNRNRLNTFMDMYKIIYDHVYDANKPNYETWLKQVRFVDLQHLYFAVYMATFGGSNFISYTCTNEKCNKVFIKDVKFSDMIKYANDEVKDKVKGMLAMDTTSPSNDSYPVDLIQISDYYVIGVRSPSIWNVVIETASLSDKFLDKYGDLIDIVSYIDSFYFINRDTDTLIPIDTKPDHTNQAKTSARRIKIFHDIISTLSSEEYYSLKKKIKEYDSNTEDISYIIPEAVCPECGTKIPVNESITPDSMLFTRHQLAAIGNM